MTPDHAPAAEKGHRPGKAEAALLGLTRRHDILPGAAPEPAGPPH